MRIVNPIQSVGFLVSILIFVANITPVAAEILEDLQTTRDIQNALSVGNVNEAKELLDELSDSNIRDLWTINVLQKIINDGECTGALEELLNGVGNQNLRDLWAINALQNLLNKNSCGELSLNLHAMVDNEPLKDLWAINIVQSSINDNKCGVGAVALNRVKNETLRGLWNQNFELHCGLVTKYTSVEQIAQPPEIDKILELVDEISSRISIVDWSEQAALSILTKLGNLNSELGDIISSTGGKIKQAVVTGDEDYNIVCVSKDNDGLSPYSISLRNGFVEEKQFLVTYSSIDECESTIGIREAEEGNTYICAPKDNDGLQPFEILIVDFGSFHNRYIKTNVIPGARKRCHQALAAKVLSRGSDHVCASKDADGLNPFGLFRLERNENSSLVGGVYSSFEQCLDSL